MLKKNRSQKSKKTRGMRQADEVLTSLGKWVVNKFCGMRLQGNSQVWDVSRRHLNRVRTSHTSPVIRTPENDGHDNPTRLRHAATKRMHALTKMDNVVEETSFTG